MFVEQTVEEILSKHNNGFNNQNLHSRLVIANKIGLNREDIQKKFLKTGTTIAGILTKDGVVLAADTRATAGTFVADKNCFKLHKITSNIWCAGAGVAADLHHLTTSLSADMQFFFQKLKKLPRVEVCVRRLTQYLFRYRGHITVALIIGGVNPNGSTSLWYVSPNGYSHSLPYISMGSGGYFALSVLEDQFKPNLTLEEGVEIVSNAIEAGIKNDLGSGSNVDVVQIPISDPTNYIVKRSHRSPVIQYKQKIADYTNYLLKPVVISEEVKKIEPFRSNSLYGYI